MRINIHLRSYTRLAVAALASLAAVNAWAQANQLTCQATPAFTAAPPTPATSRGSDKAPITILVFSDFESFPCARSATVLAGLLAQTPDARLIFKHAPAASNQNALLAHEASLASGAQGKFWEMHNLLFSNQTMLSRADLLEYAKTLGLNLPAFQHALDNHTYRPIDRKSTRLNSSHLGISYAVFCFKKQRKTYYNTIFIYCSLYSISAGLSTVRP